MRTVSDYFGSLVFDDRVMRAKLPSDVYASLKRTIDEGASLDTQVAEAVASAMRPIPSRSHQYDDINRSHHDCSVSYTSSYDTCQDFSFFQDIFRPLLSRSDNPEILCCFLLPLLNDSGSRLLYSSYTSIIIGMIIGRRFVSFQTKSPKESLISDLIFPQSVIFLSMQ